MDIPLNKKLRDITSYEFVEMHGEYKKILDDFRYMAKQTPNDVYEEMTMYGLYITDNLIFILQLLESMQKHARN